MEAIVLPLNRYRPTFEAPLFIFVDLQREFLMEGRPLQIIGVQSALENCRRLLALARARRFPIAHLKLTHALFNETTGGELWIDEFRPHGSEMVFAHAKPSCYSNSDFKRMMDNGGGAAAVLCGLAGSASCLATLIDAHSLGHRMQFAFDASSSNAMGADDEVVVHQATVCIAAQFAELLPTQRIISDLERRRARE